MTEIRIGDRLVGQGHPCYLVAELSGNHNGSLDRALATVRAASEAGADAIKLQTYTPDTLTIDHGGAGFVVPGGGPWGGRRLYDLYTEAMTPWEWHPRLFEEARSLGLQIFSTPFDKTAVAFLDDLGVPVYKVASFELVDDGLLTVVAETGKPIVLSTGMAGLEEVAHAIATIEAAGGSEVLLLHCVSSYPVADEEMNLSTIPALEVATGKAVGLSDHSMGISTPLVALALGACFIEKHFTLSRADGGVDSHFSLEPTEFARMVENVRRAEEMIGRPFADSGDDEKESLVFRRSLYVVVDVGEGELLTEKNVRSIRPGHGLPPKYLEVFLGRKATRPIARGTPLGWDHITT
jgi:pseudaminic acid synthase